MWSWTSTAIKQWKNCNQSLINQEVYHKIPTVLRALCPHKPLRVRRDATPLCCSFTDFFVVISNQIIPYINPISCHLVLDKYTEQLNFLLIKSPQMFHYGINKNTFFSHDTCVSLSEAAAISSWSTFPLNNNTKYLLSFL